MQKLKRNIHKVIKKVSLSSIQSIVNTDPELKEIWEDSYIQFPDFKNHFTIPVDGEEIEARIRLLVATETLFMKKTINRLDKNNKQVTYADIGDSDGSVRLLLKKFFAEDQLKSIGINLQQEAVDRMNAAGLEAVCIDAIDLAKEEGSYDVISLFETMEHLPDPIGFLEKIHPVGKELIISVPYVRKSKVKMAYLDNRWPKDKKATIENQHIFELAPYDWEKLFQHTGWKIKDQMKLLMYRKNRYHRLILEPYWRYISFEGFWFVSLIKDDTHSSRYTID